MSSNNEPCLARPTFINLNPIKLPYNPFMSSIDRCNGSFNTFDDPSGRICVPNKTEDINLNVFNMVTRINKPKLLKKT